ncbi:MAG TPA: hypothetical protein VG267_20620 [Terracidiphilus sp.]|jgi:hypothetical protein|nr:hypothetical protein [Terracidiphilus sp.]
MFFLGPRFSAGKSALMIGGLLLPPAGLSLNAQMQRSPGALAMGSNLGYSAAFPVVKNEPYTANVVIQDKSIGPDGKKTIHEALNIHMRDSAGRLRDEQVATSPDALGSFTQAQVHIIDPVSMQDIQWFPETKTFLIGTIPAVSAAHGGQRIADCSGPAKVNNTNPGQARYESLGDDKIEGIPVKGCRITRTLSGNQHSNQPETSITEIWASPELQINILVIERYSDGIERQTKLSNITREEPDQALFRIPEDYTDALKRLPVSVHNTNPNYAKLQEYGRIEWHGHTATLFAGNIRPLDEVAHTLSTCLGIPVSSEDPRYVYAGDLLEVTDPEWAARHPGEYHYAPVPVSVEIAFDVDSDGMPTDLDQLLEGAVQQVNRLQPYGYRVYESSGEGQAFYSFVPTTSHNEKGVLEATPAYLDQKITIAPGTAPIHEVASMMTRALSAETGQYFDCCQAGVIGHLWGEQSITYQATNESARTVLEDLMRSMGGKESYSMRCEPMDKRFCFITVGSVEASRKPRTAAASGVCSGAGYDAN